MKKLTALIVAAFVSFAAFAQPSEAAFSVSNLTKLSAGLDSKPQVFSYEEVGATLATITAANYLVDTVNSHQPLEAGDLLYVTGSDGQALFVVLTATASANTLQRFSGHLELQAAATWDPASLADAVGETSSGVTVTGAALGDFCIAAAPYDLQDILLTCYVSATNTVEMRLQNEGGATVDLASGSYKVRVIK